MEDQKQEGKKRVETVSVTGPIWYIGWLFTIAFAKLTFWKAVLALIIWPYYLGNTLSM